MQPDAFDRGLRRNGLVRSQQAQMPSRKERRAQQRQEAKRQPAEAPEQPVEPPPAVDVEVIRERLRLAGMRDELEAMG